MRDKVLSQKSRHKLKLKQLTDILKLMCLSLQEAIKSVGGPTVHKPILIKVGSRGTVILKGVLNTNSGAMKLYRPQVKLSLSG